MKTTIPFKGSAVALASFVASSLSAGITYDVVQDFSLLENTDSSTWSYRISDTTVRDGSYELLDASPSTNGIWNPDLPYWQDSDATGIVPGIGVNATGSDVNFVPNGFSNFVWPNDTVWMHPTPDSLVVVSWLADVSGLYDVEFSFTDIDSGELQGQEGGIGWFVDVGDSTGEIASGSLSSGGTTGLLSYSNLFIAAGSRVNFIVSPPAEDHRFDSTALTATITAVPEPGALLSSLTASIIGLLVLRRRRA